jgi:hypothetical protein
MLKPPSPGDGDHLSRPIERLYAVGLPERRADGRIVERAHNALLAVLSNPVA